MKTYKKQETFDIVVRHLLTQSEYSVVPNEEGKSESSYRSPQGLKCAVGCLIPDDGYRPGFEGLTVYGLSFKFDMPESVFGHDVSLCCELQIIHDVFRVKSWKDSLIEVGLDHSLDVTVCNEFDWDEGAERYVLKKSA